MMGIKFFINSLCIVLVFSISGCDTSSSTLNTQEKPKSDIKRAYSGKPVAPVQLEHRLLGDPQTGIPLNIFLKITPAVEANSLSISLNSNPELFIVNGDSIPDFSNLTAGHAVTHTIEVIPQADSKHHLEITVYIDSATGRSGARSFSITFTTATIEEQTELPSAVKSQPADDEENLIIQKGVETRTVNP